MKIECLHPLCSEAMFLWICTGRTIVFKMFCANADRRRSESADTMNNAITHVEHGLAVL